MAEDSFFLGDTQALEGIAGISQRDEEIKKQADQANRAAKQRDTQMALGVAETAASIAVPAIGGALAAKNLAASRMMNVPVSLIKGTAKQAGNENLFDDLIKMANPQTNSVLMNYAHWGVLATSAVKDAAVRQSEMKLAEPKQYTEQRTINGVPSVTNFWGRINPKSGDFEYVGPPKDEPGTPGAAKFAPPKSGAGAGAPKALGEAQLDAQIKGALTALNTATKAMDTGINFRGATKDKAAALQQNKEKAQKLYDSLVAQKKKTFPGSAPADDGSGSGDGGLDAEIKARGL